MRKLIESVKTRLFDTVPELRYIDEDWGQLDYYSPNQPVKWPCAIIEVTNVNWGNEANHVQLGFGQLSVRVADIRLSNSNVKAPARQQDKNASIFDLISTIYASLHGWTSEFSNGPLTRIMTRKVKRDDGIREFEMIFSVQLVDDAAKITYKAYPMTPDKIRVTVEKA